jgi:hypothetical protein
MPGSGFKSYQWIPAQNQKIPRKFLILSGMTGLGTVVKWRVPDLKVISGFRLKIRKFPRNFLILSGMTGLGTVVKWRFSRSKSFFDSCQATVDSGSKSEISPGNF